MSPRWYKILRDLFGNWSRSLLIVLSISVGVIAIGTVLGMQQVLSRALPEAYARIQPASAVLTSDPFDADMVEVIRKVPGVAAAEGRFTLSVRLKTASGEMRSLQLQVVPDAAAMQVNRVDPQGEQPGAWPPPDRALVIERASLGLLGAQVGDRLHVQLANGSERTLPVAGTVHDLNQPAATFTGQATGFISLATLEWFGYPRQLNQMLIVADGSASGQAWFQTVAFRARDKLEKSGRRVYWTDVRDPTQYWFETYLTPMAAILGALGVLSILLSCFLVVNTVSALLAQQVRQIGVMKAIGARAYQMIAMYLGMVAFLGALALALALPLGALAARAAVWTLAGYINFDPPVYQQPLGVMALQAALSLLMPCLAAVFPILSGTGISVREAIASGGAAAGEFGAGLVDRLVGAIQGLSRPLLLSLRNTFRRKGRLALTLVTLALGSAIFVAVQSVQASLVRTLDETLNYYHFDVLVSFERTYRTEQVSAETLSVPGVAAEESWGMLDSHRVRADGSEGGSLFLVAPPAQTQMIRPWVLSGRWLLPEDENAVVINTETLKDNPDLRVGSDLVLRVEGSNIHWTVVGIVKSVLMGPWVYVNYPYYAYRLNKSNLASSVYVVTDQHGEAQVAAVAHQLEDHLNQVGVRVSSVSRVTDLRRTAILQFNVLTGALMIMALLIALVGGLGLSGTMSLNVLERIREIGVMRAIGATPRDILWIVIGEGLLIGFISWLAGCLLAVPLGTLLGNLIGMGFLQAPLSSVYSFTGAALWLGVVLAISALASLAPAISAVRTPVREVLVYE
jgi:putative ABC transport system permease protein